MRSIVSTYGFFYLIFIFALSLIFLKSTHSYFTDSVSSSNNVFSAAEEFSCVSCPVNPGDVLINEISPEGTSGAEFVEIFNKTGNPVNVSGWKLFGNVASPIPLPSVSPIPANGYGVIVASSSFVSVPVSAIKIQLPGTIFGGLSVSGDRLKISLTDNTEIDKISWGSDITNLSPAPSVPVASKTLSRRPNGVDTDASIDWVNTSTPSAG